MTLALPCLGALIATLLAAPATPAPAAAAPTIGPPAPAVEFRWDAPDACPSEADVLAQLESLLGGSLAERRGQRLTAIARVRQDPDGAWDLRLWTVSDAGTLQRSLRHDRCDMLARAGVLIAAMAIDPLALDRMADGETVASVAATATPVASDEPPPPPDPPPQPAPQPAPQPTPTQSAPPQPAPPPPAKPRPRGALRLSGGLAYGDLPGLGATLRLTPALVWPRVRLELEVIYDPTRRARFADEPGVGADLQLAAAAVRACPVLRRGRVEVPLCAGLELGAMYGRGVGFALAHDGRLLWAALHLIPGLFVVAHKRVAVFFAVEGALALARPRFTLGGEQLYRAAAGAVRGLLGVEVRFP